MAADSTVYDAVLKEVWGSDALEDQLYQGNPLLESVEKIQAVQVGDKAIVPVHTGRAGGYSAVPRTGTNSLNAADAQETNQAQYNYTHHWFSIEVDTAIVDESSNKSLAVASVVDTEVTGALNDMRKQLTRQAFGNGDALIAETTGTATSDEVELDPAGFGYDAIVRGHLYPGLSVDIGTTANDDSVVAGATITEVEEVAATPSITVDSSVTVTGNDFVSITNARADTVSFEMNGLRNLIGSASTVVGTLDPATVPTWKPAQVNTTSQALSLPVLYEAQRNVFQKTGAEPDWALTSAKQYEALYKLLQAQVRFSGDGNLGAGNLEGLKIGNTVVQRQPDCQDRNFFFLTKKDLFVVRTEKPSWATQKYSGNGNILEYVHGTTRLKSSIVYRIQLGLRRRNSHASLTALT